jgi:hypothetical protein
VDKFGDSVDLAASHELASALYQRQGNFNKQSLYNKKSMTYGFFKGFFESRFPKTLSL